MPDNSYLVSDVEGFFLTCFALTAAVNEDRNQDDTDMG